MVFTHAARVRFPAWEDFCNRVGPLHSPSIFALLVSFSRILCYYEIFVVQVDCRDDPPQLSRVLRKTPSAKSQIPCGLVVRIRGFHPRGPGSIPGMRRLLQSRRGIAFVFHLRSCRQFPENPMLLRNFRGTDRLPRRSAAVIQDSLENAVCEIADPMWSSG